MHIAEGIITGVPAIATTAVAAGLAGVGVRQMRAFVKEHPQQKPLLGMAGAFIFFMSLIPLPAFTGTCSHPCGTPLAGILLGPWIAITLSVLSLLLQAAFFAHGGFSTLGVNVLSLGVAGAGVGWLVFHLAKRCGLPIWLSGALAGLLGDVTTYAVSGLILALALVHGPKAHFSLVQYLLFIYGAYLPTQGPIALGEMFLTGFALHYIYQQRPEVLEALRVLTPRKVLLGATTVLGLLLVVALGMPAHAQTAPAKPAQVVRKASPILGLDEAVNERVAADAGVPARAPYLNTESLGDVWNCILLFGGGIAGFILGRWWHLLFVRKEKPTLPTPTPAED